MSSIIKIFLERSNCTYWLGFSGYDQMIFKVDTWYHNINIYQGFNGSKCRKERNKIRKAITLFEFQKCFVCDLENQSHPESCTFMLKIYKYINNIHMINYCLYRHVHNRKKHFTLISTHSILSSYIIAKYCNKFSFARTFNSGKISFHYRMNAVMKFLHYFK